MISSSKHLSSERQTSFSQMHPSDKTCRIRAAGNLSESYFWIYYNQPRQLISYLQHINGEGKDKYIKTCHGNLKMVGVFSLKEKNPCTFTALSFNTSCTAWPLLLEDLNELPNYLNGISFIFIFLKLGHLKMNASGGHRLGNQSRTTGVFNSGQVALLLFQIMRERVARYLKALDWGSGDLTEHQSPPWASCA